VGDLANGHACDAFILAFGDDIIDRYRSKLLDETFGERVRYYVAADEDWSVRLFAAITKSEGGEDKAEEHFCLEHATRFFPTSDDIVDQVLREFSDLDKHEAERRLAQGEEEAQREAERFWQETLNASPAGDGHG
jgi:hypothetical protein